MESQTTPVRANPDFQWYPFSVSYLSTLAVEDRKKYVSNLSKTWTQFKDAYYKHHNETVVNEWELLLQFYQKFQQWTIKTNETTTTNDSMEDLQEKKSQTSEHLERNRTIILQWNTPASPTKTKTLFLSADSNVPEEFYVQPNEPNEPNEINKNEKTETPTANFFVPDSQTMDGEEQASTPKPLPDVPEIPNSVTEISTQNEDEEEAPKETADKIELDKTASQMHRQETKPLDLEALEDNVPENDNPSTPLQPSTNGTSKSTEREYKPQQNRRVSSVIRALENDSVIKNKLPSPGPEPARKRGRPKKADVAKKRKELEMMQKIPQQNSNTKNYQIPQTNNKAKPSSPVKNTSPLNDGKEFLEEEHVDVEGVEEPQKPKSPHKTRQDLLGEIENLFKEGLLSPKKARIT